jgi:DNA-binding transcriptional ArsR family regulator
MSRHSDNPQPDPACSLRIVDSEAVSRARAARSEPDVVSRATAAFAALGDPTRFRILEALLMRELCVCDLAEVAGISESGVSHQLRVLRDRGLVAFRRDGQRAVYSLADGHVRDLIAIGLEHAGEERR